MRFPVLFCLFCLGIVSANQVLAQNTSESTVKIEEAKTEISELEQQNHGLRKELTIANKYISNLQTQLNTLQASYDKLQRESKAYAEAIRKQFKALQERAGQVMQAKAWTIDPASRKAMVAEVESLRNQVAEGDKAALATVSGQVYKIDAFGEVLDKAKQTLAENYNKNAVATATANLQRADIKGFSSEVGQEKQRVLALLTNYCTEYARVQDVFRQFNDLNKPQTTLRLLPKLMSEPGSIDPGHTFIRKQLDYRKANPAATDQPFTAPADCK